MNDPDHGTVGVDDPPDVCHGKTLKYFGCGCFAASFMRFNAVTKSIPSLSPSAVPRLTRSGVAERPIVSTMACIHVTTEGEGGTSTPDAVF